MVPRLSGRPGGQLHEIDGDAGRGRKEPAITEEAFDELPRTQSHAPLVRFLLADHLHEVGRPAHLAGLVDLGMWDNPLTDQGRSLLRRRFGDRVQL